MSIDPAATLSQFLGSLPTFVAVILAWMHSNGRITDTNKRIDDVTSRFDRRFDDLKEVMRAEFATARAEMRRMEDVMDARLRHLEENL